MSGRGRALRWIAGRGGLPLAAAIAVAALGGCGGDGGGDPADAHTTPVTAAVTTPPPPDRATLALGRRVFATHCQSCHTLLGRRFGGTTGVVGPNLDEVRPSRAFVEMRVRRGGIDMQMFDGEIPERRLLAVVEYVTANAGRAVPAPDELERDEAVLAHGRHVFEEACATCHPIAGADRTGDPTFPGTDFNEVKPSARWVKRAVLRGIDAMDPLRPRLAPRELDAVARYVEAVAGPR